jgi:hypothetical protein
MANKPMKVADWARMFHDIDNVKRRILCGEKITHWRDLSEEDKLAKNDITATEVKRLSEIGAGSFTDVHLKHNWHEITDLEAYGIHRPPPDM